MKGFFSYTEDVWSILSRDPVCYCVFCFICHPLTWYQHEVKYDFPVLYWQAGDCLSCIRVWCVWCGQDIVIPGACGREGPSPHSWQKKVPQKHTPSDPLPLGAHPLNCAQLSKSNSSTKTETARKTFSKTEIMWLKCVYELLWGNMRKFRRFKTLKLDTWVRWLFQVNSWKIVSCG